MLSLTSVLYMCFVSSPKLLELEQIPDARLNDIDFDILDQLTTDEVAKRYFDLFCTPMVNGTGKLSGIQSEAAAWLTQRGFHTRIPPTMLFAWWAHKIPGANDMLSNVIYDVLHCYFIGKLQWL